MTKINNATRAKRAAMALKAYTKYPSTDRTRIRHILDLITDLLHLAAQKDARSTDDILRIAQGHFEAEIKEDTP